MQKKRIEIVVPCYNEEPCVRLFYEAVCKVMEEQLSEYDYSFLYVDDGSRDRTVEELRMLAEEDPERVKYISFSRNFGKESALYVGLLKSTGDYVVPMDADLQHPPALLPEMVKALEEGYDCAGARRVSRVGEPAIRSAFSRGFYKLYNKLAHTKMEPGSTDYRMMKRNVVQAIVSMQERERFTKGIYAWVGFKTKWIEYENVERVAGNTKWSFKGLMKYAVSGYIANATAPLRFIIYIGLFIVLLSLGFGIQIFVEALRHPERRGGYATIMMVMLFLGGMIIMILGVIGEYLARIYMETKKRPIFIIRETNLEGNDLC